MWPTTSRLAKEDYRRSGQPVGKRNTRDGRAKDTRFSRRTEPASSLSFLLKNTDLYLILLVQMITPSTALGSDVDYGAFCRLASGDAGLLFL